MSGYFHPAAFGIPTLRVGTASEAKSVAGALAGYLRDPSVTAVELQGIGAGAVNQAVKAVAIARSFFVSVGEDLACWPSFREINDGPGTRTAMVLLVRKNRTGGLTD